MFPQAWMRLVCWQLVWMGAAVFGLVTLGSLSLELFFLLAVLGLFVLADLTDPVAVQPEWRSRLRVLLAVGLVGFTIVIAIRILAIRGITLV